MHYCSYYQADVVRKDCWFFTATLRSFEHLSFDRTICTDNSTFELFVPAELEQYFIQIMNNYKKIGIILNFRKMPNRLAEPNSSL